MNTATLKGNIGKDPELKVTATGIQVCKTSIATTESWKDPQSGEKKTKTEWHNLVIWGKRGETFSKYVKKGSEMLIQGKIRHQEYKDSNDVKKYATTIEVTDFEFCGKRSESSAAPDEPPANFRDHEDHNDHGASMPAGAPAGGYDDDIPF